MWREDGHGALHQEARCGSLRDAPGLRLGPVYFPVAVGRRGDADLFRRFALLEPAPPGRLSGGPGGDARLEVLGRRLGTLRRGHVALGEGDQGQDDDATARMMRSVMRNVTFSRRGSGGHTRQEGGGGRLTAEVRAAAVRVEEDDFSAFSEAVGIDVKDWLGHCDIASTVIYAVTNRRRTAKFDAMLRSAEIANNTD